MIITSPESLGNHKGHIPRVARLIHEDRGFSRRISRVFIDEAHNIFTSGLALYGILSSRPMYGELAALRVHLPQGTPFQALSGTLPPHISSHIINNLQFRSEYATVAFTSNRANITYATRKAIGSLGDFRNIDFVMPPKYHTIIFFDKKQEAHDAATYLDNHPSLSASQRGKGLVKEYHGTMSTEYLKKAYDDIASPTSGCKSTLR